jgi:hypothetical protein
MSELHQKMIDGTHTNYKMHHPDLAIQSAGKGIFKNCYPSWIIDDLVTKDWYESGRSQSLKWLYLPHQLADEGGIEVWDLECTDQYNSRGL